MPNAQELATVETVLIGGGVESIGGPQSITLKLDVGPEGTRGNYFYPGIGSPEDFNFSVVYPPSSERAGERIYDDPKRFDWYLNLKPGDETYLSIFQQQQPEATSKWERIFKLIPNVYRKTYGGNRNPSLLFNSSGIVNTTFTVSNVELPLQEKFSGGYGIPDYAIEVDTVDEMLLLEDSDFELVNGIVDYIPSNSNPAYVYVKDRSTFFKTVSVSHNTIGDWLIHAAFSLAIDIEHVHPVVNTFKLSMPTFTRDINNVTLGTYSFTIAISATMVDYATGTWSPLTGNHAVHITLSVV